MGGRVEVVDAPGDEPLGHRGLGVEGSIHCLVQRAGTGFPAAQRFRTSLTKRLARVANWTRWWVDMRVSLASQSCDAVMAWPLAGRHPGRYGLQTPASCPAFNKQEPGLEAMPVT